MASNLETQGRNIANALFRKGMELDTLLKIGMEEACIVVEGAIVLNIKNDTGQLAKATHHRVIERERKVVGQVANNAEHAPYYEFGTGIYAEGGGGRTTPWSYKDARGKWHTTRGMQPRHPMMRGFNSKKTRAKEIIKRRLKQAL